MGGGWRRDRPLVDDCRVELFKVGTALSRQSHAPDAGPERMGPPRGLLQGFVHHNHTRVEMPPN